MFIQSRLTALLGIFVLTTALLCVLGGCGPGAKIQGKPAASTSVPTPIKPITPALPDETPPPPGPQEQVLLTTEKAKEFASLAANTEQKIKTELERLDAQPGFSKVVGLSNCGNTCYMNSLLQALLHSDLGRYTEVPFNQINFAPGIDKNTSLFKLFYDLALDYRNTTKPSVSTQKIAAARELFMPTLAIGQQADADEYLNFFLNQISTELNVVAKPPAAYTASDAERANFLFQYNWVRARDYSIVQALFDGFEKSVLSKTDGQKSIKYDVFKTLSLPISQEENAETSLETLLANFSQEEMLSDSGDNKSKKLELYKAPRTLIIQLKRFKQQSATEYKKITTKVSYPERLALNTPADGQVQFDLFAIVLHSGSLSGGHYTAQIKTPDNNWSYVSDENVAKSNSADALSQKEGAYLLFYKKRP